MTEISFKLLARVSSSSPDAIRAVLKGLFKEGSISEENDEFVIETTMKGANAKELNRTLLSALRKVEKKTRLRAEWTSKNMTEKYFDYVLKKKSPPTHASSVAEDSLVLSELRYLFR